MTLPTATELIEFRADQMIQAVLNEREVYRVDDKPNVQFKPKNYWHNKDWTDSGAGKKGPSGTKTTKAIFALPRKKDAAFYTAPRDTPRASIRKPDGSQHILFQQSDRERVAGNRPTLSTFSRKSFKKAGQSGELITGKKVKPTSRETIKDPIGFMKKHGRVSFVRDLGKTVDALRGLGKIVDTENLPNKTESLAPLLLTATELIEAKLSTNDGWRSPVHTEVEFVCHNTEYPSSTPLQKQIDLHQELSKVPGLLSYRQDFSHQADQRHRQIAHAVILPNWDPNHNHDELLSLVRKKAREHGVDIDLVGKVSDRKVLDVQQGNVEGYIK